MVYDAIGTQNTELPTAAELLVSKAPSPRISSPKSDTQEKVNTLLRTIVTFGGALHFFFT